MKFNLIDKTPRFNLSVVTREAGIHADTLRAWERRYGLPQPKRSEGGHRLYSQLDIETIRWLQARLEEGMRIKQAVAFWQELIRTGKDPFMLADQSAQKAAPIRMDSGSYSKILQDWVLACKAFDEIRANQVLNQAFSLYPIETVCQEVILMGLSEIGAAWYRGEASVQQEHFMSALASRRIEALIASISPPFSAETVLLAAPEGEDHTISLLILSLMLKRRSWQVVYLGANVPSSRLNESIDIIKPKLLIMSAMSLQAAASLHSLGLQLMATQLKLAFGGGVFVRQPGLQEKIAGTYLGDTLPIALEKIEQFLRSPQKPEQQKPVNENKAQRSAFERIKAPLIQAMTHELARRAPNGQHAWWQNATEYFTDGIQSALQLGDISIMENELRWINGLLRARGGSKEELLAFTDSYCKTLMHLLPEKQSPLYAWCSSQLKQ